MKEIIKLRKITFECGTVANIHVEAGRRVTIIKLSSIFVANINELINKLPWLTVNISVPLSC